MAATAAPGAAGGTAIRKKMKEVESLREKVRVLEEAGARKVTQDARRKAGGAKSPTAQKGPKKAGAQKGARGAKRGTGPGKGAARGATKSRAGKKAGGAGKGGAQKGGARGAKRGTGPGKGAARGATKSRAGKKAGGAGKAGAKGGAARGRRGAGGPSAGRRRRRRRVEEEEIDITDEESLEEGITDEEIANFQVGKANMEQLINRVCEMLSGGPSGGTLQGDVWRRLKLTVSDGFRLALKLEWLGLITREKVLEEGRWTYRLILKRTPISTRSIVNAPCLTCPVEQKCTPDGEVSPHTCDLIRDWVLAESARRRRRA